MADMADPALLFKADDGRMVIHAAGRWTIDTLDRLPLFSRQDSAAPAILDGAGIEALDPSGAYRLMTGLSGAGFDLATLQTRNLSPSLQQVWKLVAENLQRAQTESVQPSLSFLAVIGRATLDIWAHVRGLTNFVGQLATEMFRLTHRPDAFRLKEFVAQAEAIFVYAIPITAAMLFLLGVVFAYLMGVQAQKFGANIFVVDGLTAAVLRELSPVIVAILVAGRTGAAITAQLGTMKVNEEIDALSVLGLSPVAVLVLPRILALVIALPLLVFIGDVAGLLGGMLVAKSQLGLEFSQFWDRLDSVVKMKTLLIGIGKAPVFAIFIGLIACRMGMTVARDARSVGLHTTSTVVQSIVAVIVLNAIFAVIFPELEL
jgi:phospholipid/cholesterol/gamma-HCH transport system permease protein